MPFEYDKEFKINVRAFLFSLSIKIFFVVFLLILTVKIPLVDFGFPDEKLNHFIYVLIVNFINTLIIWLLADTIFNLYHDLSSRVIISKDAMTVHWRGIRNIAFKDIRYLYYYAYLGNAKHKQRSVELYYKSDNGLNSMVPVMSIFNLKENDIRELGNSIKSANPDCKVSRFIIEGTENSSNKEIYEEYLNFRHMINSENRVTPAEALLFFPVMIMVLLFGTAVGISTVINEFYSDLNNIVVNIACLLIPYIFWRFLYGFDRLKKQR